VAVDEDGGLIQDSVGIGQGAPDADAALLRVMTGDLNHRLLRMSVKDVRHGL
jgi:hypothetical protein